MSTETTAAQPALLDDTGHHWQLHCPPDFRSHAQLQHSTVHSAFIPDDDEHARVRLFPRAHPKRHPYYEHLDLSPNAARALAQCLMAAAARAEEVDQHRQQLAAQQSGG